MNCKKSLTALFCYGANNITIIPPEWRTKMYATFFVTNRKLRSHKKMKEKEGLL